MPRKRGKERRELKPLLHIFCEGEKSEPNYLRGYVERYFPGMRLVRVCHTPKNTPLELVQEAASLKKSGDNLADDQYWVVYDREASNKYSKDLHARAWDLAHTYQINIALSNVCFEVWLLLHYQKTVCPYSSYSDLRKRSRLTKHIKNYEKGKLLQFSDEKIAFARRNAKKLNEQTVAGADRRWTRPYQWNPYTDVPKLLDAIDVFGRKYSK